MGLDRSARCTDATFVRDEFQKEVTEHRIRETHAKLTTQIAQCGDHWWCQRDKQKHAYYEENVIAMDTANLMADELCNQTIGTPTACNRFHDTCRIWQDEINKYRVLIKLGKKTQHYQNIMDACHRVQNACPSTSVSIRRTPRLPNGF